MMKFPAFNRVKGGNVSGAAHGAHSHSYTTLVSMYREGLRLQCWCGNVITYTPYMDIEIPRRD